MNRKIFFWLCVSVFSSARLFALDVDVTAAPYNAIPDDGANDSAAFSGALSAVVSGGGGTVFVPGGEYHFTSKIAVDLASAGVSIVGDGKGVSMIHCTNSSGIFWFNNSSNDNELTIRDITFTADMPGAGTAIQINNPSLCTNDAVCSLYMENVTFLVNDWSCDHFNRAIYTSFLQQPAFVDVIFTGPLMVLGAAETPAEYGFRINYGNDPYFENCYSKCVDIGYLLSNIKGDVVFDRCNAVGTEVGFRVSAIGTEDCAVVIRDCHSNALQEGIEINNADCVELENGLSYCSGNAVTYTDYILNNCANVNIVGCDFHQPYATSRTLIDLKGTTSNVLIKHNIFNPSGTRVQQDAGVSGVTVTQNLDNPTHAW